MKGKNSSSEASEIIVEATFYDLKHRAVCGEYRTSIFGEVASESHRLKFCNSVIKIQGTATPPSIALVY